MNKHLENLKNKREEIDIQIAEEEKRTSSKKGALRFFSFCQNNSGGRFTCNDKLCHNIIIEAHNYDEARLKALGLGVYFDGCSLGIDCSCCGDRWYDYEDIIDVDKMSKYYKQKFNNIEQYAQRMANEYGWTSPDYRIYYYNGEIKEIFKKGK